MHNILLKITSLTRYATAAYVVGATAATFTAVQGYNRLRPFPVFSIKHTVDNTIAKVDVSLQNGGIGPLKDVTYEHKNLDCLNTKGYNVRSYVSCAYVGSEPILQLRNSSGKHMSKTEFQTACKECNVSTLVKCKNTGSQTFDWDAAVLY